MFRKLQAVTMLLCMISYASAGTVSIGTASARGDMRVDSYMVKGNATLFDGSVVETGQATADLRLEKGTEIRMATGSLGTLYRDRLVLQRGQTEFASNSFQLEAIGLRVTPNEPNSRAVVSLRAGNTVEVAALNGSFGVANIQGALLANVHPGRVVSFAIQASDKPQPTSSGKPQPTSITGEGMVTFENGKYYITIEDVAYEVTCRDLKKYVNTKVVVTGILSDVGTKTLCVHSIAINGAGVAGSGAGMGTGESLLIVGGIAAAGAGIGLGIAYSNQGSPPASR